MIYLASPYSNPDKRVRLKRYHDVLACAGSLIRRGLNVWSPIAQCHWIAQRYDLPTDAGYWQAYNEDFIRRADAVHVLCLDGWRESKGVGMEIAFASRLRLPVTLWVLRNGEAIPFGEHPFEQSLLGLKAQDWPGDPPQSDSEFMGGK